MLCTVCHINELSGKQRLYCDRRCERRGWRLKNHDKMLACHTADGNVSLWNMEKLTKHGDYPGPANKITTAALTRDGLIAASALEGGEVKVWELETGKAIGALARKDIAGFNDALKVTYLDKDGNRREDQRRNNLRSLMINGISAWTQGLLEANRTAQ